MIREYYIVFISDAFAYAKRKVIMVFLKLFHFFLLGKYYNLITNTVHSLVQYD